MKAWIAPVMAGLLLVGVSGTGRSGETAAVPAGGKGQPLPEGALPSCRLIAAILGVYPNLTVRTSEGPVRDPISGQERSGCLVRAAGPARILVGEVPPDRALRDLLGQLGWDEDPRRAPGDPGTTSFALRKDRVLCLFTGDALSGTEFVKAFAKETYELAAGCTAQTDR